MLCSHGRRGELLMRGTGCRMAASCLCCNVEHGTWRSKMDGLVSRRCSASRIRGLRLAVGQDCASRWCPDRAMCGVWFGASP